MSEHERWIGVDFDRVLIISHQWVSPTFTGTPVWPMVDRVRRWLAEGLEVRVVTGRVASDAPDPDASREAIEDWTERILGKRLKVQAEKGWHMTELWDDKAVQLQENTGKRMDAVFLQDCVADAFCRILHCGPHPVGEVCACQK